MSTTVISNRELSLRLSHYMIEHCPKMIQDLKTEFKAQLRYGLLTTPNIIISSKKMSFCLSAIVRQHSKQIASVLLPFIQKMPYDTITSVFSNNIDCILANVPSVEINPNTYMMKSPVTIPKLDAIFEEIFFIKIKMGNIALQPKLFLLTRIQPAETFDANLPALAHNQNFIHALKVYLLEEEYRSRMAKDSVTKFDGYATFLTEHDKHRLLMVNGEDLKGRFQLFAQE